MARTPFECEQGDYEGGIDGAIHHCDITGHSLSKTQADGTVLTISVDDGED